jgi:membrane fusion protein, multidrug efflux system
MHATEPTHEQEVHDQAEFDAAVNRDGKLVLAWLGGIGVVAALLLSILAVVQSGQHNTVTVSSGTASPTTTSASSAPGTTLPAKTISLKVIAAGKIGPDGIKHDSLTKTEFAVKVGQKLDLTIDNTDEGEHSITSPQIGVNIVIKPGIHTYELVVKEKGRFSWFCLIPCDDAANGWAMQHAGFMSGFITAT